MIGKVVSGQGKGTFYVQRYAAEFQGVLGFFPYGGTLNIQLPEEPILPPAKKQEVILKNYGLVDCYPVLVQKKYKGAIVRPHQTTNPPEIVEMIAPVNLRDALHLKDGDDLECELA